MLALIVTTRGEPIIPTCEIVDLMKGTPNMTARAGSNTDQPTQASVIAAGVLTRSERIIVAAAGESGRP